MADVTQTILAIGPTVAVLIGILVNNSRLNHTNARIGDPKSYVDTRFNAVDRHVTDLQSLLTEKVMHVEQVMDARLRHLEENR
jgi:hypothetical protein